MSKTITIHRLDAARAAADSCVHFGFCTAVCPTYVLDGEELDSPRGRIALAREVLSGAAAPSPAAVRHLDRCLSCLSCETTCAAGVSYRDVIDGAREAIEQSGVRPLPQRLLRSALARVLTTPALLRPALAAGRLLRGAAGRLGGPLGALASLSSAPGLAALARRGEPDLEPPADATRRVALLDGCAQSVLGAEINASALRLLARGGVAVVPVPGVQCCGALELHMGRREAAVKHMTQAVRSWSAALEAGHIDAIVSTTSGCGSVIKRYEELLSDRPDLSARVKRVVDAVTDITQIAAGLPLSASGAAQGLAVSYHDACSLKHGLKLERPPRRALGKLGLDVRDIAESHLCCGSAGTYNILEPAIANRLGQRKAAHASAGHPDVIAAGNMGCLVQMSRFTPVPVAHTVQLLDWATGGPPPRGLEHFRPAPPRAAADEQPPAAPPVPTTAGSGDLLW
ncbi:glycolate oxidase subunit GlcF [Achromobacter denitrificans]|nr:glycolate oxidase subunit GlcF [Achromobacter denitrificans]